MPPCIDLLSGGRHVALTDVSLKTELAYKAFLFLLWPLLAMIMMALLVVVLVSTWPAIWFLKVKLNSHGGMEIEGETLASFGERDAQRTETRFE